MKKVEIEKYKEEDIINSDLIEASNYYLTEALPDNFHKLSEKKLNTFIEDHLWQPFEYEEIEVVWEHIETLASGMRAYINKQKGLV
jgi:hypothetical protein